jgi:hypothetical protein
MTLFATTNVDEHDAGLASGLLNTSQQVGGALGLAILSSFAANRTSNQLSSLGHRPDAHDLAQALVGGYQLGFLAGAGLLLAVVALAVGVLRNDHLTTIDQRESSGPELVPLLESDQAA